MMNLFYEHMKDAVRYASNRKGMVVFGTILVVTSLVNKNNHLNPLWKAVNIFILLFIGYGSYISWYSLNGSNKHPDLGNYKRLFWEGFKKSLITITYSIPLTFLIHVAKESDSIALKAICIMMFAAVYLCLIGGLINRYLYHGEILKAFDFPEIIGVLRSFDLRSFVKVIIAIIISQTSVVLVLIGFNNGFSLFEMAYSLSTFFIGPFLFFATKRFVGLNLYDLLKDVERH